MVREADRGPELVGHLPDPKPSGPPFPGPWGTGLSAAEPTAAGRWFLDGGPLASASDYFWSHS